MSKALRVKGHARHIEAANVHGTGMYRRADGYIVVCSCRQWQASASRTEYAISAHEQHKADVLSGAHAARRAAEAERLIAMHTKTLADIDAGASLYLTRAQVQGFIDRIKAGDFR